MLEKVKVKNNLKEKETFSKKFEEEPNRISRNENCSNQNARLNV